MTTKKHTRMKAAKCRKQPQIRWRLLGECLPTIWGKKSKSWLLEIMKTCTNFLPWSYYCSHCAPGVCTLLLPIWQPNKWHSSSSVPALLTSLLWALFLSTHRRPPPFEVLALPQGPFQLTPCHLCTSLWGSALPQVALSITSLPGPAISTVCRGAGLHRTEIVLRSPTTIF